MGAWQITKKDLWHLVRDRRAFAILLAFPLVFITLIGFSADRLMGWRNDCGRFAITIVSPDPGRIGQRVVDGLKANEAFAVRVVRQLPTGTDKSKRKAGTIVTLAPDFETRLLDIARPRDANSPQPSRSDVADRLLASGITIEESEESASANVIVRQALYSQLQLALVQELAPAGSAVAQVVDNLDSSNESRASGQEADSLSEKSEPTHPANFGVYEDLVPSYTVLFAFFLVNIMARSFLSERDLGTLRRLRMAPLSAPALLVGKTAPFFVVSVIQSVLLFICGKLLFGMWWGPAPWLLLPVIFCTSLAATSIGLLLATLVRTDSQVSAYANFLVLAMAGVSGCFVPRDWLPETMQRLSLITPHAWALIAYHQLLESTRVDVFVVVQCCAVLAGFSAVFFLLGTRGFRRLA